MDHPSNGGVKFYGEDSLLVLLNLFYILLQDWKKKPSQGKLQYWSAKVSSLGIPGLHLY
jgi:hypothetical protein